MFVILTSVPVLSLTAVAQLSCHLSPSARSLWHKSNRSPSTDCPHGGQHNLNRQIFAERAQNEFSVVQMHRFCWRLLPNGTQNPQLLGGFGFVNGQALQFREKMAARDQDIETEG
jgi:hypothetical protein